MTERSYFRHQSPPQIFVSVASKGFRFSVSALESTFAGTLVVIDSKGLTLGRFGHDFDRWRPGVWLEKVACSNKKTPGRSWRHGISQLSRYAKVMMLSRRIFGT